MKEYIGKIEKDSFGNQRSMIHEMISGFKKEIIIKFFDAFHSTILHFRCVKANDFIVDTSLVGCVLNGLSLMSGVTSKLEFAISLYKGLAGNINESRHD